jgi:hypothetical protein
VKAAVALAFPPHCTSKMPLPIASLAPTVYVVVATFPDAPAGDIDRRRLGSSGAASACASAKKPVYPPAGIGQLLTDRRMIAPAAPCDALSFNAGPPGVASEVWVEPGCNCELDAGADTGGCDPDDDVGGALESVTPPDAAIDPGAEETAALDVGAAEPCDEVQPAATNADPAIRTASPRLLTASARAGRAQGTPSSRK